MLSHNGTLRLKQVLTRLNSEGPYYCLLLEVNGSFKNLALNFTERVYSNSSVLHTLIPPPWK